MFLNELKPEHKELFLDISIYLSTSDGSYDDIEKKKIVEMCREMDVPERTEQKTDFETALKELKNDITTREKRIILLEAGGIVLADGTYSQEEIDVMKEISSMIELDYSEVENGIEIIKKLREVYSEIGDFLTRK